VKRRSVYYIAALLERAALDSDDTKQRPKGV
jgi:hypothetical protein